MLIKISNQSSGRSIVVRADLPLTRRKLRDWHKALIVRDDLHLHDVLGGYGHQDDEDAYELLRKRAVGVCWGEKEIWAVYVTGPEGPVFSSKHTTESSARKQADHVHGWVKIRSYEPHLKGGIS